MSQTTVSDFMTTTPKPGTIEGYVPPDGIITAVAKADIEPGLWVGKDAADTAENPPAARHPDAATEVTTTGLGIALYDSSKEPTGGDHLYEAGDVFAVLRKGKVWVTAEDAAELGASPFVRHVAAGAEKLGAFRSDADGTDATQNTRVVFRTSTSGADELVLLEINLP